MAQEGGGRAVGVSANFGDARLREQGRYLSWRAYLYPAASLSAPSRAMPWVISPRLHGECELLREPLGTHIVLVHPHAD